MILCGVSKCWGSAKEMQNPMLVEEQLHARVYAGVCPAGKHLHREKGLEALVDTKNKMSFQCVILAKEVSGILSYFRSNAISVREGILPLC